MKRLIALVLSLVFVLMSCTSKKANEAKIEFAPAEIPEYSSYGDASFLKYVENKVYTDTLDSLDSDEYFIENVQTLYYSQEYIDELLYNSQTNIYFGFTLSELEEAFGGEKYVFTLGDDGKTTVKAFEAYDDTFEKVMKNLAIGGGVILVCVTVSAVTAGLGTAPAVSSIFAFAAKGGIVGALSSGAIGGIVSGTVTGIKTKDFKEALKAAAVGGSEGFKWGAITGSLTGGAGRAIQLKGATVNGLTMNQVATIQHETKWPIDVIKQFNSMEQYNIAKSAGLTYRFINGRAMLVRSVDLNFTDEIGRTNLQRMQQGLAALDSNGVPYELHHIGQKMDSTLAMLTQSEHRLGGNSSIWHLYEGTSEIDRIAFAREKSEIWKEFARIITAGGKT